MDLIWALCINTNKKVLSELNESDNELILFLYLCEALRVINLINT